MPFKLSLAADVRPWLRGTQDVEKSLDELADSLDDLARDTKQNSDKAADSLTRDFRDAFDKVKTEAKTTGRKLGTELKDGTKKAGEGVEEFADEANQSAKEAAASFTGNFDDVADYIQEVLAQSLAGFGPMGAAAGVAAAAGIGMLVSYLQDAADKAHEAQDRVNALADDLSEVKGNPELLDWFERIKTVAQEVVDKKDWWQFWKSEDVTYAEQINKLGEKYSWTIDQQKTILAAIAGDQTKAAEAQALINRGRDEELSKVQAIRDEYGNITGYTQAQTGALDNLNDRISKSADEYKEAREQNELLGQSQEAARESNERFKDSLKDAGSVLDDFGDKILKGGKINFKEWTKLQQQAAKDNKAIIEFDAKAELSPEAKANFRELPRETQALLAKEWKKAGKADKQKIEQHLDIDAKGKVDTSKVKPAEPITVDTKVNDEGAVKGAQDARDKAQNVADGKKIEFRTKVNSDGLQAAVNRAAAEINPPTIYVKVKAKKEVP